MESLTVTQQRTERILRELRFAGKVSVDGLSQRIGVSPSTVRRDLQGLEGRGLLRRTHGGAMIVENLFYEPFRHVSSFHLQEQFMQEEKRRIGLVAAELIDDGETISICAGTTTTQIARSIRHRKGIKIFTNSVNIAMELSHRSDLEVVISGGSLSGEWFALVGPKAIQHAGEHFVDKVFVGADGLDADRGITDDDPAEAAVHNAMLGQARQRIVVVDHTKLGKIEGSLIWPAKGLDILVTDRQASEEALEPFRANGIDVRIA
jgi:DeoR family transcriptional regulator of aga operon